MSPSMTMSICQPRIIVTNNAARHFAPRSVVRLAPSAAAFTSWTFGYATVNQSCLPSTSFRHWVGLSSHGPDWCAPNSLMGGVVSDIQGPRVFPLTAVINSRPASGRLFPQFPAPPCPALRPLAPAHRGLPANWKGHPPRERLTSTGRHLRAARTTIRRAAQT